MNTYSKNNIKIYDFFIIIGFMIAWLFMAFLIILMEIATIFITILMMGPLFILSITTFINGIFIYKKEKEKSIIIKKEELFKRIKK